MTNQRPDLERYQKKLIHNDYQMSDGSSLLEVIEKEQPDAIIGLSGVGGLFREEHIRAMLKYTDRPIVMACSNPTSKSECTAEQAYDWSDGSVIFSSGSPFDKF
jgi:malic enzyme